MPIYEYICENCNEELEVIQKVADKPISLCPSCNQQGLKKKTSMSAFHLKGGGWYKDGYGNGKPDSTAAKTNNGATKKTETKTDQAKSTTSDKKTKETTPKSKAS